jgi:hypothetical protein
MRMESAQLTGNMLQADITRRPASRASPPLGREKETRPEDARNFDSRSMPGACRPSSRTK